MPWLQKGFRVPRFRKIMFDSSTKKLLIKKIQDQSLNLKVTQPHWSGKILNVEIKEHIKKNKKN